MPKNPNSKSKQVKRDESMSGALNFFLAGWIAEMYLLMVRRFYVNGNIYQQIAWYDHYLFYLMGAGAALLVIGVVCAVLWKADKKKMGPAMYLAAVGAFLGLSALLTRWNPSSVSLMATVVPVAMVLSILWTLYDRKCALSLTILGTTIMVLWICRKQLTSMYLGTYVKILVVAYILVLIAVALLTKLGKLGKLLPAMASQLPVYVACGLSAASVLAALFSTALAYYAMWGLAIVIFGLAVYYTVKQL